ncbi:carbamoyltransferase HypF [uncultured Shewanella sp.]|uniref:carbamoyltransferase HypF n=1 Tax=uncultured Shewanella sp. TaxID=173975 RepID=UPI002602D274|nr:carbamoyltransferase HypF [uncultured Shewanella sp.]
MTKNLIKSRLCVKITGIVQGVGFRPYVYRLAHELNLTGNVLNNSKGVTIEIQGHTVDLAKFENALRDQPPPLARIDSVNVTSVQVIDDCNVFGIIHSENESQAVVAVSSDKCTCSDCFGEINDPKNRHFRYPFTNCTNCGPRYSLINALPYDRPNTAMAHFSMCPDCERAYLDPMDRRYHAQPVSCPKCGPQLSFKQANLSLLSSKERALEDAIHALIEGKILAIKGIGGFHLVCDATNDSSVERLRQRKNRPAKPFAVMVESVEDAAKLVTGSQAEWLTLSSAERPITLMRKVTTQDTKTKSDPNSDLNINTLHESVVQTSTTLELSDLVAPEIDRLGIFLPYTPLHQLLLGGVKRPLVMTSANLAGEPIITDSLAINNKLAHVIDNILDHDRPIINGCDDSVVQLINDKLQVLRLARGYAPLSLYSEVPLTESILALGAQQKNSVCFGFEHNLFLSPHIGDLVSIEAEEFFHHTLNTFSRLYGFTASRLVHDCHPDYPTSRWALSQAVTNTNSVQHHYAHVLSVMAVNKVITPVLGFSFDGTGLGDDYTLWGGEALYCDVNQYQRLAHLKPFALLGGEQAIKQPVRLLIAILLEIYSPHEIEALNLPAINALSPMMFNNLVKLWQAGNGIITSSVGRLFDAVAVALGLVNETLYEGQAGILIETAANSLKTQFKVNNIDDDNTIHFHIELIDSQWDASELLRQIIERVTEAPLSQYRTALIAKAFMDALSNMLCEYAKDYLNTPIVLCGGVFQNRYLLERSQKQLIAQGNQLLSSDKVPINDAGIALGQLWHAMHNNYHA